MPQPGTSRTTADFYGHVHPEDVDRVKTATARALPVGSDRNVGSFAWSPDGTAVAFNSNRSGTVDITAGTLSAQHATALDRADRVLLVTSGDPIGLRRGVIAHRQLTDRAVPGAPAGTVRP